MSDHALWQNRLYVVTASATVLFFLIIGIVSYFLQKKNPKWIGIWASIKSWVITSPILFIFVALPSPWPLIFIVMIAISGAKTFFRMTGMYHRSWFVWLTYVFIIIQGYSIYMGHDRFFNIMPMIFLACTAVIPILRNSYTQMIQFIALSLINFIIVGWGFMHLGRIMLWDGGPLIVLYLGILFEFCEATNYAITRSFGHTKPINNISTKFSLEGFFGSMFLTILLAWGLRHMLPDRSEIYWLSAALIVSIIGRLGGLTLSVIRRDLNIKETGIFIIGRDDILSRIDKPMFAAPVFYFVYLIIQGIISI
ncbi:MAG: phosphatidate cytidylyltransferase [Bdellovibrionales bacterium]|nr:phosphatidate cytidylyltransferase [Bdellovibrionales bacterium]